VRPPATQLMPPASRVGHISVIRAGERVGVTAQGILGQNVLGTLLREGYPCHVDGLWKQAEAWMPERSGHAVSEGPEGRSERPETWQG
jgi:hypothetical protein